VERFSRRFESNARRYQVPGVREHGAHQHARPRCVALISKLAIDPLALAVEHDRRGPVVQQRHRLRLVEARFRHDRSRSP
jgi:hypothetical protein